MVQPVKPLADEHHVIRYAPWSKLRKDEDENVHGLLPQALELRPGEEYLSVTWIEFFEGEPHEQYLCAVSTLRSSIDTRPKGAMAKANVGKMRDICRQRSAPIRIVHEPEDPNEAHAAIRRVPFDNMDLLDRLVTEAFFEFDLNKNIPVT